MVNFGPRDSLPPRFEGRRLLQHNPNVTLMRTNPVECAGLGRLLAAKLNGTRVPVIVFAPTKGMSAVSVPGAPFFDPDADEALVGSLKAELKNPLVQLEVIESDINDPGLGVLMADALDKLVRARPGTNPLDHP
jgi:uncharacterized protein (UPF0261 family)